jgi:hypothetical protein
VLQPLEGDGDAECQCCFGDDHTVRSGPSHQRAEESVHQQIRYRHTWYNAARVISFAENA